MKTRKFWIISLAVLVCSLGAPVTADDEVYDLDTRISIELAGASAADTFMSFAALVSAEPDLDSALSGKVTIQLTNVSARTTMNAVCEMLNCKWWITEGPPRQLKVKSLGAESIGAIQRAGDLDTAVSLSLSDAPVEEVFKSFAKIGHWELILGRPTVTVELDDTPIRQALDEVCAQVNCTWSLDQADDGGVLRIDWID